MNKTVTLIVVVLLAGLSWIFLQNFTIVGLDQVRIVPRMLPRSESAEQPGQSFGHRLWTLARRSLESGASSHPTPDQQVLRVATFNLRSRHAARAKQPHEMDILVRIARRFDVLALQGLPADREDLLPQWVEAINRTGVDYDFALGPRVGPADQAEHFGFLFNRRAVQLDRAELYTVEDCDDLLTWDPLVAWFRAVGPSAEVAFTFTCVSASVAASRAEPERDILHELLRAVQEDGRGEDDVILAGDLRFGPGSLGALDRVPHITYAVHRGPTSTTGEAAWDNLVFQKAATVEFNGHCGIVDFLREYNLTLQEAVEVSDHLPVWTEFSVFEGGSIGRLARHGT